MSTPENVQPESKSSIKASLNAKGDPQFEIKIVEGADPTEIERLRGLAVSTFRQLRAELGGAS